MQKLSVFKARLAVDSIPTYDYDVNKGGARSHNQCASIVDVVDF